MSPTPRAADRVVGSSPTPPGRPRAVAGVAGVLAAVGLLGQALLPGTVARTSTYFAVLALAVALAVAGARREGARPATRLVALGVALSMAGDLAWQVHHSLIGAGGTTCPADALWLASYGVLAAGLWRLAHGESTSRSQRLAGWIDAVVVLVAALLVAWQLSISATVYDGSLSVLDRVVQALYPAADAALIAVVVRLVATRRRGDRTPLVAAAACACWLYSDVVLLLQSGVDGFDSWTDSGWLLGSLLLAAVTWVRPATPAPMAPGADHGRSGLGRLAVCLAALVVPPSVDVVSHLDGHSAGLAVFVSTVLLAVLVFARAALLLRSEARARALVRSREQYAAKLAAWSADAVVVVDRERRFLSDPAPLAALLGVEPSALVTMEDAVRAAGADPDRADAFFQQVVAAGGTVVDGELSTRRRGEDRWLGIRMVDLTDDGDVRGIVLHVTDVTSRRSAERMLVHTSLHDGLTGLANRTLFTDRVGQALLRTVRGGGSAAVVTVDLDGFKAVNDTLGHDAGDLLLFEVAGRLRGAVRADDTVARLGGDEFAVLVEQPGDGEAHAVVTAERLLEVLTRPIQVDGTSVTVTAAVGIALGRGNVTAGSLIADADLALQAARSDGRGGVRRYDPGMRAAAEAARELEQELRGALERGEFRLVYQPVVTLADRRVTGFEALLRWESPRLGPVGPDRFVPAAETAGLIGDIGAWVLREACGTAAAWRRAHPGAGDLTIAVNVSAAQLTSAGLVDQIAVALTESGLPAGALVLEVTETALVRDPEHAAASLTALRTLGVRLALDDFGTGYSSLAHLRQFTVDVLKIDRSFVSTMAEGEPMPAIVRGTIDLGRTLGLEVLAEGVEHDHQARLLVEGNCDSAQGYLFARPLERPDAEAVLLEQATCPDAAVPSPRVPRPVRSPA
ncbi:PAS domain S-box-containing protein/diguanylate cyclase (GGDEF)-like protein [Geodermatophilus tzadiensis]|uniref:PAS domain S-box-containing protein/diguanylate cyclase (GGDEF)-like protein n=1 Tax=Geodermatophilus tzadiensis TaxID=1137988 RepID=A0A2T0TZK8_9ACTN|nr:GGDEF and EAL domain-containing protein [Geodermatophilus tzadiensis]PRY51094.1 PAS domain S-box-containing protein/diguanylate cyclase (GGDEF)-like protein [Geodermatophilus tzadiensis]